MSSRGTWLLILGNAFVAALWFVASCLVAARMPGLLPWAALGVGLVGVWFFTRRAEELCKSLRADENS